MTPSERFVGRLTLSILILMLVAEAVWCALKEGTLRALAVIGIHGGRC